MEKRIDLEGDWGLDTNESRIVQFAYSKQYGAFEPDTRKFTKTACCDEALAYAATVRPEKGKRIILVSAVGELETWGDNKKADAFPRNAILGEFPADVSLEVFKDYLGKLPKMWGYKCFPTKFDANGNQIGGGNTFNEHINRFPAYMLGKPPDPLNSHDTRHGYILASFWNHDMRRVELIQEVWEHKNLRICKALDEGFLPGISMACDIPFDRCSVCGNLAPTENDYCIHLVKQNGMRGAILPSYKHKGIYMYNDFPDFFDSSTVGVRAATEAGTLTKVASLNRSYYVMPSYNKGVVVKSAALVTPHKQQLQKSLQSERLSEKPFSYKTASILREVPLTDLVTVLGAMEVYPTGEDFARMLYPNLSAEKNAMLGQTADKYLLDVLYGNVDLGNVKVQTEALPELGSKDTEIPLEVFEYVGGEVEPYLRDKSYSEDYIYTRSKTASNFVDLSVPYARMDDKSKTIILLKIFTDQGLMERIHASLVSPLVQFELEKRGIGAIYNNSSKDKTPVFGDLAQTYMSNRKRFYN